MQLFGSPFAMSLAMSIALMTSMSGSASADDSYGDSINQCITSRGLCWQNLTDTSVDYCIETDWHITYHKKVHAKILAVVGYGPLDTTVDTYDRCGWNRGVGISAKAVDRGVIFYKAPGNASLSFRPTVLPPRIRAASNILHDTYPSVEIATILCAVLGTLIVLPILCCMGSKVSDCLGAIISGLFKLLGAIFFSPIYAGQAIKRGISNRKRAQMAKKAARTDVEKSVKGDSSSWNSGISENTMYEKV